jgi:hypothetical protein
MNRVSRWGVYVAAVLVAVVAVWLAIWSPNAGAVIEAQDRIDGAALRQSRVGEMLASAERFASQGDGPTALERVQAAVPEDPSLAAFVLYIDEAARSTGCVVRGLNPRPAGSPVRAPAGMTGIGIDLVVVGPMDQVQAFLVLASRLPRSLVIDEMQINQESDRLVEMAMVARVFEVADPDAPVVDVDGSLMDPSAADPAAALDPGV